MTKNVTYTVIIPTHHRPHLLARSLASIKKQCNSQKIEIIVISDEVDKETEDTCRFLLDKNDIYIRRNGKPGPSESRNIGLNLASGDYVMFLDDDDAWHENYMSELEESNYIGFNGILYGNCNVIKEQRPKSGCVFISESHLNTSPLLNQFIYVKNQIHMSCIIFPRWIIGNTRFDSHMKAYEDWEFFLSILDKSTAMHIPITISKIYEVTDETSDRRGDSLEANDFNAVLDYLYVYRRHASPSIEIKNMRSLMLQNNGLSIHPLFL